MSEDSVTPDIERGATARLIALHRMLDPSGQSLRSVEELVGDLRELLAQTKGSVRLLAEELEAGADPLDVASRMHQGADYMRGVLE